MFNTKFTKTEIYSFLTGIFCTCLLISNILAFKVFALGDIILPCSVIIFPITYMINDILAEIYGLQKTKTIIYLGFLLNLLAVFLFQIAIYLPAPSYFTGSIAFETVLTNSLRVLIASFSAYLLGSLINSYLMVYLKKKAEKYLFFRCITSTFFGECVDSFLFISIAFYGSVPLFVLITMIIAQTLFKTGFEIVTYPITRKLIFYLRSLKS
ncbi:queuosine precursor transporter [Methanobrevibacter sp. OttesenSCG-928-K11]|nr:queuosine precursor transporter [Methanobrevibacter sp. OttesenSCG-928-K11]